jgi:hypothetical protein
LVQPHAATVVLLDPVEYVAELLSFGEVAQFRGQVLLKGLVALFGFALKGSMDFLGKVTDQYIRHACIMLTPIGGIKRQRRPSHEWIPCGTIHV